MTTDLTAHVHPSIDHATVWHVAPVRLCRVCTLELPAGYMRHPTCDARWLQKPAAATTSGGEANR